MLYILKKKFTAKNEKHKFIKKKLHKLQQSERQNDLKNYLALLEYVSKEI